tara:strand:+ start:14056 stop:14472 length:417 start_codon:yes stop_codon:yes gene_type:complete
MPACKIKLDGPEEITYDTQNAVEAMDLQMHITKDIWQDNSSVVVGKKKSYLLHQGLNYKMIGYLHSLSYSLDVVRSSFAKNLKVGEKYEIHIKKIKEDNVNSIKIYLYKLAPGWIYNGLSLVDKFKIIEVPKVEIKYD